MFQEDPTGAHHDVKQLKWVSAWEKHGVCLVSVKVDRVGVHLHQFCRFCYQGVELDNFGQQAIIFLPRLRRFRTLKIYYNKGEV